MEDRSRHNADERCMMPARAPLVLVVTGNADTAETVCGAMRRASFTVALAGDGRSALRSAAQQPPALVLSDVRLADMEAGSLLGAMRELPGLAEVPAIALRAAAGPGIQRAGFRHAVPAPIEAERVVELAQTVLSGTRKRAASERPHVLLVQSDEEQRRRSLVVLRHAGYEVTATARAAEALELSRRRAPDAVVSELLMPGVDGYQLAFALRRDPRTRRLPIILTCAPSDSIDIELVTATGASALVTQTADQGDLVDAVRSRLDARSRVDPAASSVELAFLAGLGLGLGSACDPEELLAEVLARCADATGFASGAVYLTRDAGPLVLDVQAGFPAAERVHDFFGDPGLLLDAARGSETTRLSSDAADGGRSAGVLLRAGVATLLIAPVHEDGTLLGVLVLGGVCASTDHARDGVLRAVAAQAGRSLVRACADVALSRSQRQTVERLTRAAAFRDEETGNHNQRVSRYSALLASLYGLDERHTDLIAAASAMHDIGKLGIPDSILRKAGPLTPTERLHMQRHAEYGHRILTGENDPLLDLAATIALTHHERWDGGGYPHDIRGSDIPLEGRIVAISDVFDALTSDRVYRPAMSIDEALRHMQQGRGTHFDPDLLDLFIEALPQVLAIRERHPDQVPEPTAPAALG